MSPARRPNEPLLRLTLRCSAALTLRGTHHVAYRAADVRCCRVLYPKVESPRSAARSRHASHAIMLDSAGVRQPRGRAEQPDAIAADLQLGASRPPRRAHVRPAPLRTWAPLSAMAAVIRGVTRTARPHRRPRADRLDGRRRPAESTRSPRAPPSGTAASWRGSPCVLAGTAGARSSVRPGRTAACLCRNSARRRWSAHRSGTCRRASTSGASRCRRWREYSQSST